MYRVLQRQNMYSRRKIVCNKIKYPNLFHKRLIEKSSIELSENIEKFTLKDLVKFTVGVICVISLTVCTYFAVNQFVNYRTSVSYSLEDPHILDLPGLTFCLPTFIPSNILQELFPEYKFITEQIRIAIKQKKIKLSDYQTLLTLLKDIGIGEKTIKELNISSNLKPERFQAFYESKALKEWTAFQAFEFSIKSLFNSCYIEADCVLEKMVYKDEVCEEFGQPLESVIDDRKCFTYFTQLNKGNKSKDDFSIDGKRPFRIIISIVEKPDIWLAFQSTYVYIENIRLYVHPPDMVPAKDEIDFILLESDKHYDIRYTKIVSRLMKEPYVTDCDSYDLGNLSLLQSRSDCLDKCFLTHMYDFEYGSYNNQSRCIDVNFGTRKDLLRDDDRLCNMRFDIDNNYEKANFNNKVYDVKMHCLAHCKRNCVDIIHDVDVMKAERRSGEIHVSIKYKAGPFTVIEHSPEVSWFQLFSNLSAFSSLWIGFSIFSLYVWVTNGFKFIYRSYLKFISDKNSNKNLNCHHNNTKTERLSPDNLYHINPY